jgi:hypothetical protein
MPLPGSFTPAGKQILVSTHMSEDPDARSVSGIWLLEEKGPLVLEEEEPAEKQPSRIIPETPIPPRPNGNGRPSDPEVEVLAEALAPEAPPLVAAEVSETAPPEPPASPGLVINVPLPKEEDSMAQGTRGYLSWAINGLDVDIRALPGSGASPSVEQLKAALKTFHTEDGVMARLTETLSDGDAWITLSAPPGQQGKLLISTGQIVDLLTQGGVYDEVLLAHV